MLAPVMLDIDGRMLGPIVGTAFAPESSANGIKISELLDHACSDRSHRVFRLSFDYRFNVKRIAYVRGPT